MHCTFLEYILTEIYKIGKYVLIYFYRQIVKSFIYEKFQTVYLPCSANC